MQAKECLHLIRWISVAKQLMITNNTRQVPAPVTIKERKKAQAIYR